MHASLEEQIDKAAVLVEALPYIQKFRGQTFLIKVGGSAMDDPRLVQSFLRDIVLLEAVGINPVLVHGGGKAISKAMAAEGLEPKFIGGLRYTDAASIRLVEDTLGSVINPGLVDTLNSFGGKAIGVPGTHVFLAERMQGRDDNGDPADLGYVGRVTDFQLTKVENAIATEHVPVLSPVATELGTMQTLNVNADLAASSLASALKVSKLIFLSDVLGVMQDPSKPETLIPSINKKLAGELMEKKVISGGMIPKTESALSALQAGVGKVHMIDGRVPHSLLLETLTATGIGTEIIL